MNILQVTTDAVTIRAFLMDFPDYFKKLGVVFDCASSNVSDFEDVRSRYNKVFDIPFTRNFLGFRNHLLAFSKLKVLIESSDYDIIHVHTPIAAFLVRLCQWRCKGLKKQKVLYTAHGFHFYRGGGVKNIIFLTLEKIAAFWTDELVVINTEDYNNAIKYRLLPPEHVHYMPGIGVDIKKFSHCEINDDYLESLSLGEHSKVFLMIAELVPQKNHKKVIKAVSMVQDKNVVLLCAGSGSIKEKLESYAEKLGVSNRVKFLGFRNDVKSLLSVSTGLILFSNREGLPRSALEAFSAGVPVIAANIRGLNDLLSEGGGILVDNHSTEYLADSIRKLSFDQDLRTRLSCEATSIVKKYSIHNILKLYEELYFCIKNRVVVAKNHYGKDYVEENF